MVRTKHIVASKTKIAKIDCFVSLTLILIAPFKM